MPVLAACTCNPSSGRVETSESLGLVTSQTVQIDKFWASERPCLPTEKVVSTQGKSQKLFSALHCSHTGDMNVNPHARQSTCTHEHPQRLVTSSLCYCLPLDSWWNAIWQQSAYMKMRCGVWNLYFSWSQASIWASQSLQRWSLKESRPLLSDTCFVKAVR